MCLPPPRVSDKSGFISQTRQWGFVSYLKMQRVLKDFTLKSLVSVKFFQNCWWFKFVVQEVHHRCILVCQCLVYKETHSTEISPHLSLWQDPCNGDSTRWRWKVLIACFMGAKKICSFCLFPTFFTSVTLKRERENQAQTKGKKKRVSMEKQFMFSSPCSCPVSWRLARFLSDLSLWARSAPSYMTELLVWPVCLSHWVSQSYRKAEIAFPPTRKLSSWKSGLIEDSEQRRLEESFRRRTNYLNVCRPKLRFLR